MFRDNKRPFEIFKVCLYADERNCLGLKGHTLSWRWDLKIICLEGQTLDLNSEETRQSKGGLS